jgi:hypothetical protein
MALEGGCFCGAIRYRIDSNPRRVTHCHCRHCRRTSGAAFVTWAVFDEGSVTWVSGVPKEFESRPGAMRGFCHKCGSPLTFRDALTPESIDVSVGTLDTPEVVVPEDHVWFDRAIAWLRIDDGLHRHAKGRD